MRKQRPRGSTTRQAVVEAALAVVDDVGTEAFSLRAVARRVGVAPMSLYTHFANKDELLDLMYAEVARRLYADAGHSTWQAEFVALCHQVRRVLLQHPRWTSLLSRPAPPLRVPLRERLLALLTSDGVPVREAFIAVSNAGLVSLGLTLVELTLRDSEGKSSLETRFYRLKNQSERPSPNGEDPLTHKAVAESDRFDLSDNFDAAIRAFIAGVAAGGASESAELRAV